MGSRFTSQKVLSSLWFVPVLCVLAGMALSFGASMLSAVVGFALARALGREAVAALTGPRLDRAEDVLRHQGTAAVVVARLTPVLPFTIVNYGAGVSAVSLRDYLVGTAIGVVPGTVGYTALGASVAGGAWIALTSVAVGAVLLVGSILVARRMARRSGVPG